MSDRASLTPAAPAPGERDVALDGLRGLAALAVIVNHVGVEPVGGYTPPKWLLWPADASAAVIVFFVLSGYVIGLTNPAKAEPKNVRLYLGRRALRLLAITWAGVALACVATWPVPVWHVGANLLFLGNFAPYAGLSIPVISGNENLWSLNYEVLFYLLFVPLWIFGRTLRPWFLACLGLSVVGWYTTWVPLFVACYAAGFIFWLSGLGLAWHARPRTTEHANWPSCVLLLLVTWKLRVLINVLAFLPIPLFDGPVVRLYNLDVLPACLWLVSLVALRELPFRKWLVSLAIALPAIGLAIKWQRPGYFTPLDFWLACGGYALALGLWRWRPSLDFFRRFAPVGLIAFGLYAISRPVQFIVFQRATLLPQNALGYALAATATLGVCFTLAWLLERRLQPWLNRAFAPARTQKPASPPPAVAESRFVP